MPDIEPLPAWKEPSHIPSAGASRLTSDTKLFSSDLSVNEFLLVRQAGFTPIGMVLGTSIYHVGFQRRRRWQNHELEKISQAMYHARELAMGRMEEEADILGADGIVGVRLEINFENFSHGLAEFLAVGTAVKFDQNRADVAPPDYNWHTNRGKPFTSDLNGQDFWTLLQSGYAPLSLVMGSCVYQIGRVYSVAMVFRNSEIPQYTEALYAARELAMERMETEARMVQADGIVGASLDSLGHRWKGYTTEFFAIGTAIRALRDDHTIPTPTLTLPLTGTPE